MSRAYCGATATSLCQGEGLRESFTSPEDRENTEMIALAELGAREAAAAIGAGEITAEAPAEALLKCCARRALRSMPSFTSMKTPCAPRPAAPMPSVSAVSRLRPAARRASGHEGQHRQRRGADDPAAPGGSRGNCRARPAPHF